MAVVLNNQEEEKDKENQGVNQPQPLSTGGGASAAGPTGTSSAQPTSRQRQGSGRFTNLQQYIQANPGAGARTSQQIQNVAERTERGLESEAGNRLSDIRSQIGQERDRLGQAQQFAQTITSGSNEDLQKLATEQADRFAQLRTGQSAIPQIQQQKQQAVQQLGQQAGQLGGMAADAATEQGRFGLLRNTFQDPRYSAGQRRLDQLLLQGSGQGALSNLQQGLQQRAQSAQNLVGGFQSELGQEMQDIGEPQVQQAQQTVQQALGRFGEGPGFGEINSGALGQLRSQLEETRQSELDRQQNEYQDLRSQLEEGNQNQRILDLLGVERGTRLYNVDLADYANALGRGEADVSMAEVIDDAQRQRLNALSQLAGFGEANQAFNLGEINQEQNVAVSQAQKDALAQRLSAAEQRMQDFLDQESTLTYGGSRGGFFRKNPYAAGATATNRLLLDVYEGRRDLTDPEVFKLFKRGDTSKGWGGYEQDVARHNLVYDLGQELARRGYYNVAGADVSMDDFRGDVGGITNRTTLEDMDEDAKRRAMERQEIISGAKSNKFNNFTTGFTNPNIKLGAK